ncbi:MAG: hypothetical protein ACYSTS_15615 [Planctomycetota bacterium]
MLPDLPKLKNELFEVQMRFFRWASHQEMGVFSSCKSLPMFEGDMHGVERSTGDQEVNSLWKISTDITIEPSIETIGSIFAKIYDMAQQAGKQVEKNSFEYLSKSLDEAGQTINAKDRDMVDALFEMFEKIEIPLGEDGRLDRSGLQIVCGSEVIKAIQRIEQSPETKEKFENLMKQKEDKARARKANRKLVG